MASSRNSATAETRGDCAPVERAVVLALDAFVAPGTRVAVALSGGQDSMVLLDALARVASSRSIQLSAVHVDHAISEHSREWASFCADQCRARGIALVSHRLTWPPGRRGNLEAAARRERYARLCAADADAIALAHHGNDQAETVLLQLLRGAGPRGLAAMPAFHRATPSLLRPFLALDRAAIEAYARGRGVAWIDDPSNADVRHRRNFIRHAIAPALAGAFPGYRETLQRAAGHQAEAAALLDALAEHDASGAVIDGALDQQRLVALDPPRARNLLRWFLRLHALRPPSQARLDDMRRQLVGARADARIALGVDGARIGVHRGRVFVHAPAAGGFHREWRGESEVALPGGALHFMPAIGDGFKHIAGGNFSLRSRGGGERMQTAANRPRRALKKLLQDAGIPSWERDALPLLWCADALVAVPGIGVDVAFQVGAAERGLVLDWQAHTAEGTPAAVRNAD